MNFINADNIFTEYKKTEIEFYYYGEFDTSVESIIYLLENDKFPTNLKGNFAFFYKDPNRVVIAVDHAPTINLFYTDNEVSHIFDVLKKPSMSPNKEIEMQSRFFHGATFGSGTSMYEINRLKQGTYFEKNLKTGQCYIVEYIDLYSHTIDESMTLYDFGDILEKIIDKHTNSKFNLLYSSGTDSNCILGYIRKLKKINLCNLVSLYTNGALYNEKDQIEEILKIYGYKTTFYNIGQFGGKSSKATNRYNDPNETVIYKKNYERMFSGNWHDSTIWQKFEALHDTGNLDNITITGEIGDELFGPGPTLKMLRYIIQNPKFTSREVAILFLTIHIFRNRETFVKEYDQWLVNVNADESRLAAWENTIEYFIKLWDRLNKDDILNAGKLMQYHLMTPWRLLPYSQFSNVKFLHPFQDYRLYFNIWKIPGTDMFSTTGIARKGSYEIIKDYITSIPWQYKKIGPTYLAVEERLNKFRDIS
jgi:hypothetical protein